MFSSLASFLFGSSTSETKNCELNKNCELEKEQQGNLIRENQSKISSEEDTLFIQSNEEPEVITTRNKNKGGNKKNKIKQQVSIGVKQPFSKQLKPQEQQPLIAEASPNFAPETLLSSDEDFEIDENDWFFVEKEEAIASNSFSRRSSEEKLSFSWDKNRTSTPVSELLDGHQSKQATVQQYLTPRKNLQNNCKKSKCNTSGRDINTGCRGAEILADEAITQSLFSVCQDVEHNISGASYDSNGSGAKLFTMVGSWYLTPPPCFTSNGPVHMEISPFENLLIEHPSMSVYHSIRSAQKATESFENFDLEMNESNQEQEKAHFENMSHYREEEKENSMPQASPKLKVSSPQPPAVEIGQSAQVVAEERPTTGPRIGRCPAAQLKMELFAWNSQKCMAIHDRRNLRRNAILRTNQVREIDGRGNRQRRADFQHCRLISGVNNNRKCC
ncbi:uncharacterized protein LOC128859649 isoform X1 [Anastrepha ludens]|uniref:uncharacterized protein LOC128859649 isoform X1 n=1 Tax=Anastrepha ludens TaxID=28586 RepID=UPI0023AFF58D|nr:uncharacterized protein LOC128859649 isoform X1 [Anastrepha ludens]XP_053952596.1 uncharacterized protein LOC128859649 isoform X1 [Anastrepha ludens]XP_053952597.1 uncharacterized protein LOC128859649 isoform X1 [Anastrepha ludens]